MSDAQKKLLFRLCFELGATRENVREHVLKALGVERLEWATRLDASRAIDALKRETGDSARRTAAPNGNGRNGANGGNGQPREQEDDIPF
jgi:hypothetical protein